MVADCIWKQELPVIAGQPYGGECIPQIESNCRFLRKKGETMERFLGIKHVPHTTSTSLKKSLLKVFAKHGVLVARLRGQGQCHWLWT